MYKSSSVPIYEDSPEPELDLGMSLVVSRNWASCIYPTPKAWSLRNQSASQGVELPTLPRPASLENPSAQLCSKDRNIIRLQLALYCRRAESCCGPLVPLSDKGLLDVFLDFHGYNCNLYIDAGNRIILFHVMQHYGKKCNVECGSVHTPLFLKCSSGVGTSLTIGQRQLL